MTHYASLGSKIRTISEQLAIPKDVLFLNPIHRYLKNVAKASHFREMSLQIVLFHH